MKTETKDKVETQPRVRSHEVALWRLVRAVRWLHWWVTAISWQSMGTVVALCAVSNPLIKDGEALAGVGCIALAFVVYCTADRANDY